MRPSRSLRPLGLVGAVALVGALGTLGVGAAVGMPARDLLHLGLFLLPAAAATLVSTAIARPLLARSPVRQRLVAVGLVGAVVAAANLAVLARLMFVSRHDATQVAVLVLYSAGAGVGAALALARTSASAIERLAAAARRVGEGDLGARVGPLDGDLELAMLARTLDTTLDRLCSSLARQRELEGRRRDLITAVSHDLRTPLASLRAMVEAVDDGVVEDLPSLRRYAAEMRRDVDSLVALVDDLFELAQLEAGAIEAETERVRLGEVVRSAVAACRLQAREKGLSLEAELGGTVDLPCSPRLSRVLQNLLANAIRHTPSDGTVRIEASRGPGGLELVVVDTGEGIPPEDLERVFEPFWRGDPSRSGGGAGLGLALAKRIVEALGGRIEAASPAHAGGGGHPGSRFAVQLPV